MNDIMIFQNTEFLIFRELLILEMGVGIKII